MEENEEVEKVQTDTVKSKNPKSKIIIIVLIALVIVAGATYGVYKYLNTPQKLFQKNMEKLSKLTEETIFDIFKNANFVFDDRKTLESEIGISGSIKTGNNSYYIDEVEQINELLKDVKLNAKTAIDYKNEKLYGYLELEENKEKALSGEAYLSRDILVAQMKEISDSLFFMNMDDLDEENKEVYTNIFDTIFNAEDSTILKEYMDVIKGTISDDQYKVEDTTIKANKEDVKCKKVSLSILPKQSKDIIKAVLEKAKTDERVISAYVLGNESSYYTEDELKEEFVEGIEEAISQIDDMELDITIYINTYHKGKDLLKVDAEFLIEDPTTEEYYKLIIESDFTDTNNIDINFSVESSELPVTLRFTLNIKREENKDTLTIDLGKLLNTKITFERTKISNSEIQSTLTAVVSGVEMLKLNSNINYEKNTSDELISKNVITVEVLPDGTQSDKITAILNLDIRFAYTGGIEIPKTTSNDIDLVNDTMPTSFMEKLEKKVSEIELFKKIEELNASTYSEYDLDNSPGYLPSEENEEEIEIYKAEVELEIAQKKLSSDVAVTLDSLMAEEFLDEYGCIEKSGYVYYVTTDLQVVYLYKE